MVWKCALITSMTLAIPFAFADKTPLTNREIYERCSAKLVRLSPGDDDPFLPEVMAGTLTGPQACKNLLALAKFDTGGRIPPGLETSSPAKFKLAKNILATLHDVHVSWFANKIFVGSGNAADIMTRTVIDSHQPALYYTRSLFNPAFKIPSVLNSTVVPRALRSVDAPTRSIYFHNLIPPLTGFPSTFKFVGNGEMLGIVSEQTPLISVMAPQPLEPGETLQNRELVRNQKVLESLGGGILGSPGFIENNMVDSPQFPNWAVMPRTWAKNVYHDLLCRNLPVIGPGDGDSFASSDPNALPFRKQSSCLQCHASMDPMAAMVSNLRVFRTGTLDLNEPDPNQNKRGSYHRRPRTVTQPLVAGAGWWSPVLDPMLHKRPPRGRFYFRTYDNVLKTAELANFEDLAAQISMTDDFYICVAKRYYHYFTGIDVEIAPLDAGDVTYLPNDQRFYRARVVQLGKELKSSTGFNGDPRLLIEKIFDLPEYQVRDFGRESAVTTPNTTPGN